MAAGAFVRGPDKQGWPGSGPRQSLADPPHINIETDPGGSAVESRDQPA